VSFCGISQTKPIVLTNVSQIISKQSSGEYQISYADSANGYSVIIPKWWDIKETPSPNFFGGTFDEIDKSKSALLVKAFEKEKFKTLQNFENWVISSYKSGDTPKWSTNQKVLFKKNLSEFNTIGKAFKVQLKTEDTFYNCCYIIVETSKSYLWIDLTSTRETYDANFKKLEKILLQFTAF
jgi:hypothetical protein